MSLPFFILCNERLMCSHKNGGGLHAYFVHYGVISANTICSFVSNNWVSSNMAYYACIGYHDIWRHHDYPINHQTRLTSGDFGPHDIFNSYNRR